MNCWTCAYQQIGGDTFLGKCKWFELKGEPAKEIPAGIVDAGCRQFRPRPSAEIQPSA